MQDEALEQVLAGINDQLAQYGEPEKQAAPVSADSRHQFYNFVYSHNTFGPRSLVQL